MNQRELPIFYTFRFICCLMVFLYHAKICGSIGGDFVTFFIVLSGFFAIYTFKDSYLTAPLLDGPQYLFRKLKKFYPLHIIAFLLSLPLSIGTFQEYNFSKTLLITLAYNTYTQSFFPDGAYYFAFNGVEWTMSVLCFCYLMTPLIVRLLKKIHITTLKGFFFLAITIYIIQFIYVFIFKTNENCVWFCSINPLFRILDYFIGCSLGYFYNHSKRHINTNLVTGSLIQLSTLACVIVVCTYFIPRVNTAYRWSLIMTPLSVIIILVFAFRQDASIFSNLFHHKIFVTLGKVSYEIYILHLLILNYLQRTGLFTGYIYAGVALLLTLICSFFLHHLLSRSKPIPSN